ncbi:433_t:CDS:2 [Ambispora leptoticha]|uniref:433_t:CDS:1 n=1 Tax=Ambispora leptoticha TaxID=144679 RepID=A0A9N8VWV6_9GLOM|nr:433_t:CDS:2 [Ambispora leptoticha]
MSSKSKSKQPSLKSISATDGKRETDTETDQSQKEHTTLTNRAQVRCMSTSNPIIGVVVFRDQQSQQTNESDSEGSSQAEGESNEDLTSSEEESNEALEEEEEDQRSRKRRRAVTKDPNAPKRPRNAFLIYCKDEREQAKEENKGFQNVTRILSQRWKDLSAEEKKKYFDKYDKEKQRYEKEMSSYVGTSATSNFGDDDPPNPNSNSKQQRPDATSVTLDTTGLHQKRKYRKSRDNHIEQFKNNSMVNTSNNVNTVHNNDDDKIGIDEEIEENLDENDEEMSEEIDQLRDDIDENRKSVEDEEYENNEAEDNAILEDNGGTGTETENEDVY